MKTTGSDARSESPAEVRLTPPFTRSLEKLDRQHQERVLDALQTLRTSPQAGKPLKGVLAGRWSLRVGTYRVLYRIEGPVIYVQTVGHRKDAYRSAAH